MHLLASGINGEFKLTMFSAEPDNISVSLVNDVLRVAGVRASGSSLEVVICAKRDVKGQTEDEIAKTLRSVLTGVNFKKIPAYCLIPPSAVTTKNIEIPSKDPTEIKSIINLQAGRHTPYSREEIQMGYINIGVYQVNYTKVLLVIANRQVIKTPLRIMEAAGLRVEKVLFSPEGIGHFYGKALGFSRHDSPIGIIDVAQDGTDFMIVLKGIVIACRHIPWGASQLAQGQSHLKKLVEEIRLSVEAYINEDIDKPPLQYLLTSKDPLVAALVEPLSVQLSVPVKIEAYREKMRLTGPVQKILAPMASDSFLDIFAGVYQPAEAQIDLLPEETKLQRSIQSQGHEVIKLGAYVITILIFLTCLFFGEIYFKNTFLTKLNATYSKHHDQVAQLEKIAARTRIVKDFFNSRMTTLEATKELYRLLPQEIYLESFLLDDKGALSIKGISESMSKVFSLVTALEESSLFKNVKTQSTSAKKERGKDVAAFEIIFKLETAKDDPSQVKGDTKKENASTEASRENKS